MIELVDIVVRYKTSTYQARARGQRASCTSCPACAAERLGGKIFGPGFQRAEPLPVAEGADHNVTRWRLVGAREV